jgi:dUTPase
LYDEAMDEYVIVSDLNFIKKPAHHGDAGFDILTSDEPKIFGEKCKNRSHFFGFDVYKSIDFIEYETNSIIAPKENLHVFLMPRSSISSKNLVLANSVGLIDNGYRGTIKVRFKYITQPEDLFVYEGSVFLSVNTNKIYQNGDKIAQLVFAETIAPKIEEDNHSILTEIITNRASGGFGSTGL